MCCEISELFNTADVCFTRYLSCSLQQMDVLRSELYTTGNECVASYLSCSLEQSYVLLDI